VKPHIGPAFKRYHPHRRPKMGSRDTTLTRIIKHRRQVDYDIEEEAFTAGYIAGYDAANKTRKKKEGKK